MLQQAEALLKQYYGFDVFRQGQKQAIESMNKRKDTVCIMPTGGEIGLLPDSCPYDGRNDNRCISAYFFNERSG